MAINVWSLRGLAMKQPWPQCFERFLSHLSATCHLTGLGVVVTVKQQDSLTVRFCRAAEDKAGWGSGRAGLLCHLLSQWHLSLTESANERRICNLHACTHLLISSNDDKQWHCFSSGELGVWNMLAVSVEPEQKRVEPLLKYSVTTSH